MSDDVTLALKRSTEFVEIVIFVDLRDAMGDRMFLTGGLRGFRRMRTFLMFDKLLL